MPTTKNAAPVKTVPSRRRFLQSSLASGVGAAMLPALAGARELAPSTSAAAEIRNSELDELTVADLQSGMQSGKFTSRSLVEKYLGSDRRNRPPRCDGEQRNRTQSRRAGHCRSTRQGAEKQSRARAPARNSGSDQGQYRHRGQNADHRRIAGARGLARAAGFSRSAEIARGRRSHRGQDQPE